MAESELLSLNEAVRRRARDVHSDKTFIREADGGRRLSYSQCDREADHWAGLLSLYGVDAGQNVAVMAPTSADWVTAWMGINLLGARCVGINTLYRGRMLGYVLDQSRCEVVITSREFLERIEEISGALENMRHIVVLEDCAVKVAALSTAAPEQSLPTPDRTQEYGITYTSGTTGPSKGVIVTWTALSKLWSNGLPPDELTEDDVLYIPFPLNHVGGSGGVHTAALKGAEVVLRRKWSTDEFWNDIRRFGATATMLVGSMASFLLKRPPRADDADNTLRIASVVPLPSDIEAFEDRFGLRIFTFFAMTETSTAIHSELSPSLPGSCGRCREGYRVRIVDDDGADCPPGVPGELWVRADDPLVMMQGYFDMPEATAAAWHEGWFRTGDMLRCDEDGNYFFVDRKKDALRRRGENISSSEIEVEVDAHPLVRDSAAIGVPSEFGEDEVMVYVELQPGAVLDPVELVAFLRERMPSFMVPQHIEYVDELPRTPATGKVEKQQLRERGVTAATWSAPTPTRSGKALTWPR
ncbi:putative CoA ligase [Nocardia nova SH22a]|uniref:Putative CoA ligase n=1 Tax=Nocardia nova SH22a TaxID=1415166 RepID=W5TRG9_9NOCA|nr:AMP-binding protein [Nocardia nova]AHH19841.1 putative CoA ligase [Nocardia nova SH22a]